MACTTPPSALSFIFRKETGRKFLFAQGRNLHRDQLTVFPIDARKSCEQLDKSILIRNRRGRSAASAAARLLTEMALHIVRRWTEKITGRNVTLASPPNPNHRATISDKMH